MRAARSLQSWMSGSRFFTFWAILASIEICADAAFRCIGALARSSVKCNMAAYCYVLVIVEVANKPILYTQMQPWWRWSAWLLPMWYGSLGTANNEYLGEQYGGRGIMARELAPDGVGKAFLESIDLKDWRQGEHWRCVPGIC